MRVKRVLSTVLMVIFCLGLVAGSLWVLDFFAVINVYKTARQIPVVGKMLPAPKELKPVLLQKNPLQDQYDRLKTDKEKLAGQITSLQQELGELAKRLEVANKEKQDLIEAKNNLQTALDQLQAGNDQQQAAKLSYEKLAKYYAEMKPAAAVKIMDNLTDEVNIGILQNLEEDQVAKILSAMDPLKAAGLVDKMRQ